MRVFISIDIEDEEILKEINKISNEIKRSGALIKLVEKENIHMTLQFLGEISEKDVEIVKGALNQCCAKIKKFKMLLRGLGAFPNPKFPRVIWIGTAKGADEVTKLANSLSNDLKRSGFRLESRPFSPHITIARVKRYNANLKNLIKKYEDYEFGEVEVSEVRIKKSRLTPQGPIYTTLYSLHLINEDR